MSTVMGLGIPTIFHLRHNYGNNAVNVLQKDERKKKSLLSNLGRVLRRNGPFCQGKIYFGINDGVRI